MKALMQQKRTNTLNSKKVKHINKMTMPQVAIET